MGGVVNAIADVFEWVFELFDPFLSKYDKHDIYKQIQIQSLFPNDQHIFRKKLISFKHQTGSNYETLKKLILDKAKYTNKNKLEKMGLITEYNGSIHTLTKSRIELYISTKYLDSDVNIPYLVSRHYKWELRKTKKLTNEYMNYNLYYDVVRYTYSTYDDKNLNGYVKYDKNEKMYYFWIRTNEYKDPTDEDLAYETGDYIDWKISKWLSEEYDTKDENIQYTEKTYFNSVVSKVKYITYNIKDDKWYKPIIVDKSIERKYDEDNNVIEVHMLNVDDNDDDIWVEWTIDKSVLITVGYTSTNFPKGNIETFYYDDVVDKEFETHFLSVPVKKDGDMVNDDSIMLKNWLQDIGMTLPENIESDEVKDVLYAALSKYNDNSTPTLTNYNKYIYGSPTDKHNVSIDTGVQVFNYFWSIDYTNEKTANIYRGMSVNGFTYAKILECEQSDMYITYKLNNEGKVDTGVNNGETESDEGPMYLVPLEAFKRMPLNEFYVAYYDTMKSIAYAEKEVVTKWYRTEFFQFYMKATIIVIACIAGGPVGCAIAIGGMIVYELLVNEFGVDPAVAAIIVAVATWGASTAANGANAGANAANSTSTASTAGVDSSTAASNSMASASVSTTSAASQSIMQRVEDYFSTFIDNFKRGYAMQAEESLKFSDYLNYVNKGSKYYFRYLNKKENKKLENIENENRKIEEKAKEIEDSLTEMFKNSISLLPVKFDIEYSMLYSDPMSMQYAYDHMYEMDAFSAVELVYTQ